MVRQTESHNRPDLGLRRARPAPNGPDLPGEDPTGVVGWCHGRAPLPPTPLNAKTSAQSDQDPSSRCKAGWLRALIGEALEERGAGRREGGAERQSAAGFVSFRPISILVSAGLEFGLPWPGRWAHSF